MVCVFRLFGHSKEQSVSTSEQRERLARILRRVAAGEIIPKEAISEVNVWTDINWREKDFAEAYHHLQHYEIDSDIRAKKPAYAENQQSALLRCARKLEAGKVT
jgi:hypothetical protein